MRTNKKESLSKLVNDYRKLKKWKCDCDLKMFCSYSGKKAIYRAAYAIRLDGKRFDHQRRIKYRHMKSAYGRILKHYDEIARCKSFDQLYNLLTDLLISHNRIEGLGPLYLYDTACRIGMYLGYKPRYVYLHAGALEGARALRLPINKDKRLSRMDLRVEFRRMPAYWIEDFLCVNKDNF